MDCLTNRQIAVNTELLPQKIIGKYKITNKNGIIHISGNLTSELTKINSYTIVHCLEFTLISLYYETYVLKYGLIEVTHRV